MLDGGEGVGKSHFHFKEGNVRNIKVLFSKTLVEFSPLHSRETL